MAAVLRNERSLAPVFADVDQRTLPRLLAHQAAIRPDADFLRDVDDGDFVSFGRLDEDTNRGAHGLAQLGVGRGDRVGLMLPNSLMFVRIWFSVAKLGAIEVPVNPELRGKLLSHVLDNSAPQVVVCDAQGLDALAEVSHEAPFETLVVVGATEGDARSAGVRVRRIQEAEALFAQEITSPPTAEVRSSDPIAILYTSGTSGVAKGVLMPHNHFYMFTEYFAHSLGLTAEDSYYTPLPLFHADAQLFGVYFPLIYGTRGTLDRRFSASRYWTRVRASGATATNLLGAMAHILWKRDPERDDPNNPIRVAQALPMVPFKEAFEERFGLALVTGYGQTETNFVTYDTPNSWREGSCGRVAPGFEVAVVDADDRPLPPGRTGEIIVRHRDPWTVSLGYYGMPAETLRASRNLWWHSGDAGHLDEDGWLYFDGRIKDAIRRRGENVSAYEVESVVDAHDAVVESAAIAVPSELGEDDIMVLVVVRGGRELSEHELLEHCVRQMPRYMVPRYVELRHELLPRTPSEKIAKEQLRAAGITAATWDREADGFWLPPVQ